ncbi:MAG: NADH-quinone oxidoreductase subunit M [Acidimicrobiaceae bacterium]|nr:NADH-quinone oxidoreductase subunit M [Acidimicrobiaceae bacterium]
MNDIAFPILTVLVFFPVAAALAVAMIPSDRAELARPVGLVAALVELALVVVVVVTFDKNQAGFQYVTQQTWIGGLGIAWKLGVDGISLFLVGMTAVLFPVAMYGPKTPGNAKSFIGWMLLLEAACVGTFMSLDLFLFFIFFEISLVPAYFLISGFGGFRRNYAALKFFLYTFAGSAFLLVGILSLVFLAAPHNGGRDTFDLITLARIAPHLPISDQELIFSAFAVAFAVKIPLVPFHTWMPDAYSEASTSTSMILAGILFKLGAYSLLRFGIFIFPAAAINLAPVLLTLAVIGITYGAIVTVMQRDLKRLVAYATLADVGFIVLGLFGLSSQAITGGVFEMVNHGLTTGALFFLVGMIWDRRQTFRISELGGLQRSAPIFAAAFLIVVMSAVGLPGLNGFVGEFLVLVGTFLTHRWWAVVGTSGIVLTAMYLLWAYQRVFHTRPAGANAAVPDMTWRERGAILPLLIGIVFLGVYPKPLLDRVTPSVGYLVQHVQHVDPSFAIPPQGRAQHQYTVPSNQNVNAGPQTPSGINTASAGGRP